MISTSHYSIATLIWYWTPVYTPFKDLSLPWISIPWVLFTVVVWQLRITYLVLAAQNFWWILWIWWGASRVWDLKVKLREGRLLPEDRKKLKGILWKIIVLLPW